jgi:hypothetical protein
MSEDRMNDMMLHICTLADRLQFASRSALEIAQGNQNFEVDEKRRIDLVIAAVDMICEISDSITEITQQI